MKNMIIFYLLHEETMMKERNSTIRTLVNHLRSDILQDFWQGAVPDSTGRAKCRLHVEDDRLPRKSPIKQNNCERRVRTRRLTATSCP